MLWFDLVRIVLAGCVVFAGIVVSGVALLRELPAALRSRAWQSVSGVVVRSSTTWRRYGRFKIQLFGGFGGDDPEPIVFFEYRYSIHQDEYAGERVRFGDSWIRSSLKEVLEKYPEGATVRVFFDPRNPRNAVLEPGRLDEIVAMLFVGVALAGAGSGLLLWATS